MKLKHNKKRNTAFLYEVLVRNLTKAILDQDDPLKKRIINVVREHFKKGSELKGQLDIYNSLAGSDSLHPFIAEKIVYEAKALHESLDEKKIFEEQSNLINKINKSVSKDAFNIFIPNYKFLASLHQIFDKKVPVKTRVLMEGRIIKNMIGHEEKIETNMAPVDNLVFKTFVSKFNEKYADDLLDEQKSLLNKYIVSFADNAIDFKIYLNEELARLKEQLSELRQKENLKTNKELQNKLSHVNGIIEGFRDLEIDKQLIERVLKIQGLVMELQKDDA
jgi:hypothetical protein|tara:strand:+ start:2202 stop:3032 length:831 start_codon:yes stop_codon:yes gene_type:complete